MESEKRMENERTGVEPPSDANLLMSAYIVVLALTSPTSDSFSWRFISRNQTFLSILRDRLSVLFQRDSQAIQDGAEAAAEFLRRTWWGGNP